MSSQPLVTSGEDILKEFTPNKEISLQPQGESIMSSQPPVTSGEDILKEFTPSKEVSLQSLTALQHAGLSVLLGLGIFSLVAFFLIIIVWIWHVPSTPTIVINSATNPQVISDTVKTFDTYKIASDIAAEQPFKWFDGLFTKLLYPLVTLVLGYIFGATQQNTANGQE
jgi:hypothetical protein